MQSEITQIELNKTYYAVYRANCGVVGGPWKLFDSLAYITDDEEAAKADGSVFCGYTKIRFVLGVLGRITIEENYEEGET
jgi:hypothetical protein